ncbi:MAG: hypothetical protein IT226_06220 [Flavobacteriales bacterium]|nr:hypothetical protein [Flavobacteriales bacterium]
MINNSARTPTIRLSLHDSIHMIHREDWRIVTVDASPYLQYDHLLALEDAMSATMEFRYVIYYCEENLPMGVAYFQVVDVEDQGSRFQEKVCRLGKGIGKRVIKDMKVRTLVSGNVFHGGDLGSYFTKDIPAVDRLRIVEDTMCKLDKGGYCARTASILLFKEFGEDLSGATDYLIQRKYHRLEMDADMVIDLDPGWKGLDDYQEALTSKARTRIRSIRDRSAALKVRIMKPDEIRDASPRIQHLFEQVLDRSTFVHGRLNMTVFAPWVELHKDHLQFRGYFLNDELVGFSTAFILGNELDVQFVGIDYAHNTEHAIYQRMLVDLLDAGILGRLRRINFGRTAEQAKSNLGAQPMDLRFFVKHHSALANKLIGPFLRSVKPGAFEQRSPFKKVHA